MNKRKGLLAVLLVMLVTVAGISAYFTDSDTATNTFTVGKIDVELQEPSWNEDNGENVLPNETVAKDPQVKNIGTNEAYVFLEVTVPYVQNAKIFDDNSQAVETVSKSNLFDYTVNGGWYDISATWGTDNGDGTYTYVYAYGTSTQLTSLAAGATTSKLFNSVTMPNFVEGQGLEGSTKDIVINAKAIQVDGLKGEITPITVYATLKIQSGEHFDD